MKPLDHSLLADENIAPDVVAGLRARGCDVRTAWEESLIGEPDIRVLEQATAQSRVVVTHDRAFGRSAIHDGPPFVGIIYLRPGHISAGFILELIDTLRHSSIDVDAPFVVVAERRQASARVRVRLEPPW